MNNDHQTFENNFSIKERKQSVLSSKEKGGEGRWYANKIGTVKIFKMYILSSKNRRKQHL